MILLSFYIHAGNFLYYLVPQRHMKDVPVLGAIYLKSKQNLIYPNASNFITCYTRQDCVLERSGQQDSLFSL